MTSEIKPRRSAHAVGDFLLCCVQDALVQNDRDPITTSYVAAGQIAWDDCCGMLVVAPERIYRSISFPDEATGMEYCYDGTIAHEMLVLLVRCAPTVDSSGRAPTQAALNEAYQSLMEDAAVVWNALVCCDLPDDWQRANVSQQFTGADGGCIAVETRLIIGIPQLIWSI